MHEQKAYAHAKEKSNLNHYIVEYNFQFHGVLIPIFLCKFAHAYLFAYK